MDTLLDINKVHPLPDFSFLLEFENGESRTFNMKPLLYIKPFNRLKDPLLFARASVDYGTVVWPDNIDIAPETLYLESVPVE